MAGLKTDRVEIVDGGVLIKGGSAAENAALAAEVDEGIFAQNAKGADKLRLKLSSVGDWFQAAGKSLWPIVAVAMTLLVMVIATKAWYSLLPYDGIRWVFGTIGGVIVIALCIMGHGLAVAVKDKDWGETTKIAIAAVIFVMLNMIATVSFQVTTLINNSSGRIEVSADIKSLERERSGLQIATAVPPMETSDQVRTAIESFKVRAVVNQPGTQLAKSIGEAVGDCTGDQSWYVRTYCPTIKDMESRLAAAEGYEKNMARLAEIKAEIVDARDHRPQAAGPLEALKELVGANSTRMGYLVPMGIMFLLELVLFYSWYETSRLTRKGAA